VNKYLQAEGYDVSDLSPDQINALVNSYSEATGVDKSSLLTAFVAYVSSYDDSNATIPKPKTLISITGYDLTAYNEFVEDHPVEIKGLVRLGEEFETPEDILDNPNALFYMNGRQIEVNLVPKELITDKTLIAYGDDGTLHVLITPQIQGEPLSVARASMELDKVTTPDGLIGYDVQASTLMGQSTLQQINSLLEVIDTYKENKNTIHDLGGLLGGVSLKALGNSVEGIFTPEVSGNVQAFVQEFITAIASGKDVTDEDIAKFQSIVDLVNELDTIGIGQNVVAGIGDAMTAVGWDTDAETVAGDLENALNKALGIESPSKRMKPTGQNVAAGIGVGMAEQPLTAYISTMRNNLVSALNETLNANMTRPIGRNASLGIATGILSGKGMVVSAMQQVAREGLAAAKREWHIQSPSGVFRDEVGKMAVRGIGVGAVEESKVQAKVMRNAVRFLSDSAQDGIAVGSAPTSTTNTYSTSTVVQVDKFISNDKQDITSLAVEVASLTRRRQRGKGRKRA
jgi:hypothetical protein